MNNRNQVDVVMIVLKILLIVCVLIFVWAVVNSNITWVLISLFGAGGLCCIIAIGIIS